MREEGWLGGRERKGGEGGREVCDKGGRNETNK